MTAHPESDRLASSDRFIDRHLGKPAADTAGMLSTVKATSLDALIGETIPQAIRFTGKFDLAPARTEREVLEELRGLAAMNEVRRSYIGLGYSGTITPPVVMRNILENPGWYTQYTPYQAEIAQGRLEALLNFQTMVLDLTGMEVANSSLLDEATAAAEAMTLCKRHLERRPNANTFFVASHCHPQTIDVVKTRAEPLGLKVVVGDAATATFGDDVFGALIQYPTTDGALVDWSAFSKKVHDAGALLCVATDLLALTILKPPSTFGADIVVGNSQRFGVPLFYGGPHAGFMAGKLGFERKMPGRIVGVSKDSNGNPALRLALQTREQHIRRDRATSNICTAQVLLAVTASMYAVYHGPEGLKNIGLRVHRATRVLAENLVQLGCKLAHATFFDTIRVTPPSGKADAILAALDAKKINVRRFDNGDFGIALDETVTVCDLLDLHEAFGGKAGAFAPEAAAAKIDGPPAAFARTGEILTHPVFRRFHTEHELLRYMKRLESRDLSLTTSMISLGSCTMKLNATAEMAPVSYPGFANMHPFAPVAQAKGYGEMIRRLEGWLCQVTGFAACSMQPNAGSQGEYAGLLAIRGYHHARGDIEARRLFDPDVGARHEPGIRRARGHAHRRRPLRRQGQHRRRGSAGQGRGAQGHAVVHHGHVPVDARRVRGVDQGHLQDRPRPRRPGVPRRREHERDGRPVPAGRHRRRRLSPEPAQDVLHSARRRRSGHGTDLRRGAPRAVLAGASRRVDRTLGRGRGVGGAVG
jgi:glycine dehydrogenase